MSDPVVDDSGPVSRRANSRASSAASAHAAANASAGGDDPLQRLLVDAMERIEEHGDAALDALCAEHPAHADELRRRVALLRAAGMLASPARIGAAFPERLGEFRLLRRIGAGGMGAVYLAEQTALGREVALKLIRPEQLYFPGARARFQREVESVARMRHVGIAPVYTVGEADGIPYFAMERIEGCSLADVIAHCAARLRRRSSAGDAASDAASHVASAAESAAAAHPSDASNAEFDELESLDRLDGAAFASAVQHATARALERDVAPVQAELYRGTWTEVALRIARALADALAHAHAHGVLHRDIKPSNAMVTPEGRVLLMDFGLASAHGGERGASALTRTGSAIGSLPYMSPEQVRGEHALVDERADLYSLGVTLYELLTLRSPYLDASTERTRERILDGNPLDIRALHAAVPRDAAIVCMSALAPEREQRYASAAAFARDLANVLERRPIEARAASRALVLRRWIERHPARAAASALAALVLFGAPLGYAILQQRAKSELSKALDQAELQRKRADASLARALDAVERMLARVGHETLEQVPEVEGVRTKLLEDALEFYTAFANENKDRPDLAALLGRAHFQLGTLQSELQQLPQAEQSLLKAIELAESSTVVTPDRDLALTRCADALHNLGNVQMKRGAPEEAERLFERALALCQQGLVESPDDGWLRAHVARMNYSLAIARWQQGEQEAAAASHARATSAIEHALLISQDRDTRLLQVEIASIASLFHPKPEAAVLLDRGLVVARELLAQFPEDVDVESMYYTTLSNRAGAFPPEAAEQALELLREAQVRLAARAQQFHAVPDYRHSLGTNLIQQALHLQRLGRYADAIAAYRESVAQRRTLHAQFAANPLYVYDLGDALYRLARARELDEHESFETLGEARELFIEAARADAKSPQYRKRLVQCAESRTAALLEQGDVARAIEEGEALLAALPDFAGGHYQVASVYTRVAALEPDERRAQRIAQALEQIELAVANGWTSIEDLESDADLKVLHDEPRWNAQLELLRKRVAQD